MPHALTKKFNYQQRLYINPVSGKAITIYLPLIPIRLSFKHKLGKVAVDCLTDSGADINLFPADWGESVGINIKKGGKQIINGIGAIGVESFVHEVKIYLGADISFITKANFSYSQEIPLLGRTGFFNHFKRVSFFENDRILELEYKTYDV